MSKLQDNRIEKRIAVAIETSKSYPRELLRGVTEFSREKGTWQLTFVPITTETPPPEWFSSWQGDGILVRTHHLKTAESLTKLGLPTVELRSRDYLPENPFVGIDNARIGEFVARHFVLRGYGNFATLSYQAEVFFRQRFENFRDSIESCGRTCSSLEIDFEHFSESDHTMQRLVTWLQELPKPVGVFSITDSLGLHVLKACQMAGLAVPEEIAVVGCENDSTLCDISSPQLSSLEVDGFKVGYQAAALLEQMMAKAKPTAPVETLIPPKEIIARSSSDQLVVHDQVIRFALKMIREQATKGIRVADLCDQLNLSRSTLERRMEAAIGRKTKSEILRLQFKEVNRLLRDTEHTIEAISEMAGFKTASYLQASYAKRFGETPGAFRKRHQAGTTAA